MILSIKAFNTTLSGDIVVQKKIGTRSVTWISI